MSKKNFTKNDIKHLAKLSRIELTEKEIGKFVDDIETIISSVETLDNFEKETGTKANTRDLEEVEFNTLREDKVEESLPREDVLSNTPYTEDGYIKIYEEE